MKTAFIEKCLLFLDCGELNTKQLWKKTMLFLNNWKTFPRWNNDLIKIIAFFLFILRTNAGVQNRNINTIGTLKG